MKRKKRRNFISEWIDRVRIPQDTNEINRDGRAMLERYIRAYRWENLKNREMRYFRAYGWYFALSLIVALAVPDDILTIFPFLEDCFVIPISSLVSLYVPIHWWARLSEFPEVTCITLALLCVTYPILATHCFFSYQLPEWFQGREDAGKLLAGLLLGYVMMFFTFLMPRIAVLGYSKISGTKGIFEYLFVFMMTSRLGLGLIAPMLILPSAFALATLIAMHKEIFLRLSRKT